MYKHVYKITVEKVEKAELKSVDKLKLQLY